MLKKTTSSNSTSVSFQENLQRHVDELRSIGATEADIAELRSAAADVMAAETVEPGILETALQPYTTCLSTTVAPPTKEARWWARMAVGKVTGGQVPQPGAGETVALIAGLAVLRLYGEGKKSLVQLAIGSPNTLPDLVAREAAAVDVVDPDALVMDWICLMGLGGLKKKRQAEDRYLEIRTKILERLAEKTKPSCENPSPPAASLGCPGPSTGAASPPP